MAKFYDPDAEDLRPSKSQLKREHLALQKLGQDLAGLGKNAIEQANIPQSVKDALLELAAIKTHEARRRHMQYIGKLMRTVDEASVREQVEAAQSGYRGDTERFHRLEEWRDRLVEGDDALMNELFETFPDMDGQKFRQLVLASRREHDTSSKPKQSRQLFRFLKALEPAPD